MRELAAALPRTLISLPSRIASRPVRLSLSPQLRRRLLIAVFATVLLGSLYQFWFRDSALVAVSEVEVGGLTTKDAPRIEAALTAAAEEMTTLHIRVNELEEAVRGFPIVASVHAEGDFPHGLRIEVEERPAAALVSVDGVPTPVAGDGTLLRGLQPPEGLAVVRMEKPIVEGRVTDPSTLRALLVAGAAPAGMAQRIERLGEGPEQGIALELRDGPKIIFGDADFAVEKWTAAARVLADPDAAGATYIDVRLPERPVAGGLPVETIEPVAPAGEVVAPPVTAAPTETGVPPTDPAAVPPEAPVDPAATAPAPTAETAPPTATTPPTAPSATSPQP